MGQEQNRNHHRVDKGEAVQALQEEVVQSRLHQHTPDAKCRPMRNERSFTRNVLTFVNTTTIA